MYLYVRMEVLFKKRRALKRLFHDVVDRPHAYSNEQYIYTLEMIHKLLNINKNEIIQLKRYYAVNNDW